MDEAPIWKEIENWYWHAGYHDAARDIDQVRREWSGRAQELLDQLQRS